MSTLSAAGGVVVVVVVAVVAGPPGTWPAAMAGAPLRDTIWGLADAVAAA